MYDVTGGGGRGDSPICRVGQCTCPLLCKGNCSRIPVLYKCDIFVLLAACTSEFTIGSRARHWRWLSTHISLLRGVRLCDYIILCNSYAFQCESTRMHHCDINIKYLPGKGTSPPSAHDCPPTGEENSPPPTCKWCNPMAAFGPWTRPHISNVLKGG